MNLPLSLIEEKTKTFVDWTMSKNKLKTTKNMLLPRFRFGREEELYLSSGDICITESQVKKGTIFNLSAVIDDIYEQYEIWEMRLKDLLVEEDPIDKMLEISAPLLGTHCTLMNAELFVIHQSSQEFFFNQSFEHTDSRGALPANAVNVYKNDENFTTAVNFHEPFVYANDLLFEGKWLCQNIFYEDTYVARLAAYATHEYQEWDFFTMNILAKYVTFVFNRNMSLQGESTAVADIIRSMIHGEHISEISLLALKGAHNWSDQDIYQLCVLKPMQQDIVSNTLGYYCYRLMGMFEASTAIVENGMVVLIMKIVPESFFLNKTHQLLAEFIRENNFRVGISNTFKKLEELRQFYHEANIAIRFGEKYAPFVWIHLFATYALDYFKNMICSDISAENLVSRKLLILMDYDQAHHTEYVKTLQIFLEELQSPVKTAKRLYIQRGTLNYRLQRIVKLTEINFADKKDMLYLQISFMLL